MFEFYVMYQDGKVKIQTGLSAAGARRAYIRYNKRPETDAKEWGWHPCRGLLSQQILRQKAQYFG